MSGRAILLLVMGVSLIASISFLNLNETNNDAADNMIQYYNRQSANNIAQTGIHMALREVTDSTDWRQGYTNLDLFDGTLTVSLQDTVLDSTDVVMITSTAIVDAGTDYEQIHVSRAYTVVGSQGFIPASVLAAITTNNPVATNGNITIDGRDHDMNGNLVPGSGTHAIWTTNSYSRGGNSKLGSTVGGTDYSPSKTENNNTRLEGQSYPGGYPSTPDEVMGGASDGYPDGTLKSLAQSGIGGSQYVTNPSLLSFPLSGITYVEMPTNTRGNKNEWRSATIEGEGILVIHNSASNATIKNLNSGTFKGLMIADDIVHVHTDIIGAIVGLSPSPSSGNVIGNGNGNVKYSRQAIKNATSSAGGSTSGGNSTTNVVAWWD